MSTITVCVCMQSNLKIFNHFSLFLQKWFSLSGIQQYEGCTAQSIPFGQHMNPGGQSHLLLQQILLTYSIISIYNRYQYHSYKLYRETSGSALVCSEAGTRVFKNSATFIIPGTHPHKKGPVMENYSRHLTSFSMVIYQAEHDLWCPINVGWENFAQLQIFQVKQGKNGQKWLKNG